MFNWFRSAPKEQYVYNDELSPNENWSAFLNWNMDRGNVRLTGAHTVDVGGKGVWVANYPYAYGHPYPGSMGIMPNIETKQRLQAVVRRMMVKDIMQ